MHVAPPPFFGEVHPEAEAVVMQRTKFGIRSEEEKDSRLAVSWLCILFFSLGFRSSVIVLCTCLIFFCLSKREGKHTRERRTQEAWRISTC